MLISESMSVYNSMRPLKMPHSTWCALVAALQQFVRPTTPSVTCPVTHRVTYLPLSAALPPVPATAVEVQAVYAALRGHSMPRAARVALAAALQSLVPGATLH